MDNGYATVQRLRSNHEALSEAWDKRVTRAWLSGFWIGLMLGLSGSIVTVGLSLWMRV